MSVMKNAVAIFLLSVLPAAAQLATNVTVTNLQGKVFQNVTIDHTNFLGVVWVAPDGGMGEFRYGAFPMEFWTSLGLSNCAEQYYEAVKLKQDQERRERQFLEQEIKEERAQAAALKKIDKEVQDQLSASNSEEQLVDAMPASPSNMTSEEISARDAILKALLNVSSATDVGVTRNDYGDLLAKAISALAFGKTKLSPERHEKFLTCAEKAVRFYTEASADTETTHNFP
jgi:hypothetical protein